MFRVMLYLAASIITLTFGIFLRQTALRRDVDQKGNLYSLRLVKGGKPDGKKFETIYLDRPASAPSIFGPNRTARSSAYQQQWTPGD